MMTNNLHNSEQHRVRADALMSLATETSGLLRVPEFSKRLVARAAGMMNAKAAALALEQDSKLETVAVHGSNGSDSGVLRRLGFTLAELIAQKHLVPVLG